MISFCIIGNKRVHAMPMYYVYVKTTKQSPTTVECPLNTSHGKNIHDDRGLKDNQIFLFVFVFCYVLNKIWIYIFRVLNRQNWIL